MPSQQQIDACYAAIERAAVYGRRCPENGSEGVCSNCTKQDSRERNFEDGRRAALDDKPAKPPGHLLQQAEKHWLDGHAEGVKQISVSRAEGFRPLGTVAADMIGTEPPTHSEATH